MKVFSVLSLAALLMFAGCATPRRVAELRGHGTRQYYGATFDQTWRAAIDAAQMQGLEVSSADRNRGYIGARRTVRPHTFGENVGIWVRQSAVDSTEVEVVSRQAGPPALWLKNWENEIHRSIAANLTREAALGTAPRDVIVEPGSGSSVIVVPEQRETIVVPEKRETIIVPETAPTHEAVREEQRRIEELRLKQAAGERALAREVDETKREMIQRQIDRLREEMRLQEKRLRDLEQELK
jgi:hypothetical protein